MTIANPDKQAVELTAEFRLKLIAVQNLFRSRSRTRTNPKSKSKPYEEIRKHG
jgi:hypothetical protein